MKKIILVASIAVLGAVSADAAPEPCMIEIIQYQTCLHSLEISSFRCFINVGGRPVQYYGQEGVNLARQHLELCYMRNGR